MYSSEIAKKAVRSRFCAAWALFSLVCDDIGAGAGWPTVVGRQRHCSPTCPAQPLARWAVVSMGFSSRQARSARLREAINVYRAEQRDRLDTHAGALLDRLTAEGGAGDAFLRLKLRDAQKEANFLSLCILVEQLARRFQTLIKDEHKALKRLIKLDKCVTELRSFVWEQAFLPPTYDLLTETAATRLPGIDRLAILNALDKISALMAARRQIAERATWSLGATRKKHYKSASTIIALRHLVTGVQLLTGRAHHTVIRQLAPLIVGRALLDETVTYALRTPPHKQLVAYVWRVTNLLER
jgi:hypothetical protein